MKDNRRRSQMGEMGIINIVDIPNYLTIEALEDGLTASLSVNACEYCVDGDGNWKSLDAGINTEAISTGHTLSFRGNITPDSTNGIGTFGISKLCNLKGNCLSILYGDDAEGKTVSKYGFYKLFKSCTNIVSVSDDFLSSNKVDTYSYSQMFYGCTSLIKVPNLPFTNGNASYCCAEMFYECTALRSLPSDLLDKCTSVGYGGFGYMFYGCTALVSAMAKIPIKTLNTSCYQYMFANCTSLKNAPELPATVLKGNCYRYMFRGCSSLIKIPELNISSVDTYCCYNMFRACTSLVEAQDILPATTLANFCYSYMFYGCTKLTKSPILPALTLNSSSYAYMFNGCKLLNNITMLATDVSATSCLNSWVSGVASTGTFIKNPAMNDLPSGTSGIPAGWTVENYVE